MFTLTDYLADSVSIEGVELPLNLAFDTVLLFIDLIDDATLTDEEKIEIAFEMFILADKDSYELVPFEIKFKVIQIISETFIFKPNSNTQGEEESPRRAFDFKQDAKYIYASFLQEYGVDLIEQQGELRWEKFTALLEGLRDNTKFKEVVGIRVEELPKGKHAEEERKRLIKLKKIYALDKNHEDRERELDDMFSALVKMGGKQNDN